MKTLKRYKISTNQNGKWVYWTRVDTLEAVKTELEQINGKYETRVIDTEKEMEIKL